MRPATDLEKIPVSSVRIALRSQEEADQLLRQQVLHAFGRPVTVRVFTSQKPFDQCRKCWDFGHKTNQCTNKVCCRLCTSEDHDEATHRSECSPCQDDPMGGIATDCTHKLYCMHCKQQHASDYRKCSIRVAMYGVARNNNKATGKKRSPRPPASASAPPAPGPANPAPAPAPPPPPPQQGTDRIRALAGQQGLDLTQITDEQILAALKATTTSLPPSI